MTTAGHCLCGAVTFTAEDVETSFHGCHCGMCRRWGGGPAFGSTVGSVKFAGEENISTYQSSDWAERGFCSKCGSNLFYRLKEGNQYVLFMGTFDDQSAFRLSGEIYIEDKPAGYDFVGEHPRLTSEEFMAMLQQQGE